MGQACLAGAHNKPWPGVPVCMPAFLNVIIISDLETLKNINKSVRNIKNLKIINDAGANIYDMMKYKNVLLTQSSVKNLEKRILNEKN